MRKRYGDGCIVGARRLSVTRIAARCAAEDSVQQAARYERKHQQGNLPY